MTAVHLQARALHAEDAEAAGLAIRAQGLRLSTARRLVLEALYTAKAPVPAEDIADGLGGQLPRSDLASVYRNLETLEQLGIVRHLHLGHGPGRYTPAARPSDYLVCERCERVSTIEPEQLTAARAAIRAATGFHAHFDHFPISGLCGACSDES